MTYIDIVNVLPQITVQSEGTIDRCSLNGCGLYEWQDVSVEICKNESHLEICLTAGATRVKRLWFEWEYRIENEVKILGDAWERAYGDLEWRGVIPERVMPWYVMVHDVQSRCTHSYGVETGTNAMCFWKIDGRKIRLCMDVRNGSQGVFLNGRRLHVGNIVCRSGNAEETSFQAAKEFCRLMCKSPRLPVQPVYGSNNWYYAYGNSSKEEILRDTDLLRELTSEIEPAPFMVIDDGWQLTSGSIGHGGPWNQGNIRFPDMQDLAQKIKEKGARAGIWVRPLRSFEYFPEECVMKRKDSEAAHCLDPSHPFVLDYTVQMMKGIREWGYELIKHDFSTYDIFGNWGFDMGEELIDSEWHFYDESKTTAEIILQFYKAIRQGAGENVLIIGCNTISHLSAGIFEIQRTGDDTSGREWERTRKMGVNTLAFRMPQNGTFYAADADCAGITEAIDWKLNKEWVSLLAESGTPMFISMNPKTVTPEQKEYLKRMFQIFVKVDTEAVPRNWMFTTCPDEWETQNGIRRYQFVE